MGAMAALNKSVVERTRSMEGAVHYHSVEIGIEGLEAHYQFKIWNLDPSSMCVLVKEGSDILGWLKEGNVLSMKYYCTDAHFPPQCRETAVRQITKDHQGKFKGVYLVGLEILDSNN
jgi:hypothetical protein